MKKNITFLLLFICCLFSFMCRSSAMINYCTYWNNQTALGSTALVYMNNSSRFVEFDTLSTVESVKESAKDDLLNILTNGGHGIVESFMSSTKSKVQSKLFDTASVVFQPVLEIGTSNIIMFSGLTPFIVGYETKTSIEDKVRYTKDIISGSYVFRLTQPEYAKASLVSTLAQEDESGLISSTSGKDKIADVRWEDGKKAFSKAFVCPQYISFDGDWDLNSLHFAFYNEAFNTTLTKRFDLINDVFMTDDVKTIFGKINNHECLSADEKSKAINLFGLLNNSEYMSQATYVEKYFLTHFLDSVDGYNYYKAARKVISYSNDSRMTCYEPTSDLVRAAKYFVSVHDNDPFIDIDSVGTCEGIIGNVNNESDFAYYLKKGFDLIQYIGSALLLLLTMFEFFKSMVADEKDNISNLVKRTSIRMIFVALLFFIPMLLKLLLKIFGIVGDCGIY